MVAPVARPLMWPALLPQSTQLSGWPRLTWLKRLNDSMRNSSFLLSEMWKFLNSDASVLKKCGPRKLLRSTLPNCPGAALAHGEPAPMPTANQFCCVRWPSGSPTRSGWHGPALTEQLAPDTEGVNGRPLDQVVMVLSCQPPKIRSTVLDAFPNSALPRPIGKSHTSENRKTCVRSSSVGPRPISRL